MHVEFNIDDFCDCVKVSPCMMHNSKNGVEVGLRLVDEVLGFTAVVLHVPLILFVNLTK